MTTLSLSLSLSHEEYGCELTLVAHASYHASTLGSSDGYYMAYNPITLPCILFKFIEIKFIYCHSCVMFIMKSMSICND